MSGDRPSINSLSASTTETPEYSGRIFDVLVTNGASTPSWKIQIKRSNGGFVDLPEEAYTSDKARVLEFASLRVIKVVRVGGTFDVEVWPSSRAR